MAVVLSNGAEGTKWMEVGQPNRTYIDITEHIRLLAKINFSVE
jgi:alpha-amylase